MTASLLLCTDLDRTLVPNGEAPESPGAREYFRTLAARPEIHLVYVSGRDTGRVRAVIEEFDLPLPQHVISDVGSAIFDTRKNGDWQLNRQWEAEIGRHWGVAGSKRLTETLSAISILESQETSKQGPYKLSFYFPSALSEQEVLNTVRVAVSPLEIPVSLVCSIDEPRNIGLLDVLPEGADKLHAILFLRRVLQIPVNRIVFCGDSGNDLSVLTSQVPGVLVANASSAVKNDAIRLAQQVGNDKQLYVAKGSFMGMNGNYAAGILEGVCHFYPETLDWIAGHTADESNT